MIQNETFLMNFNGIVWFQIQEIIRSQIVRIISDSVNGTTANLNTESLSLIACMRVFRILVRWEISKNGIAKFAITQRNAIERIKKKRKGSNVKKCPGDHESFGFYYLSGLSV